jgi:pyruvate,water dikinase
MSMNWEGWIRGLRERLAKGTGEDPRQALQRKVEAFKRLVAANHAALDLMADLQLKASGEYLFDMAYVRLAVGRLLEEGRASVEALEELSGGRYRGLRPALARVEEAVSGSMAQAAGPPPGPPVLDFSAIPAVPVELVGNKNYRLAEIRSKVGLPVPDGFVVTSRACRDFLEAGGLLRTLSEAVEGLVLSDQAVLNRTSALIALEIAAVPWPPDRARAILDAYDDLARRLGRAFLPVSVRSSAAGEDGEFSFAGQYATVLNVGRERLLEACKEVMASQFSPRALVYYKARGLSEVLLPMAVGVIAMVNGRASGVLYTKDPQEPDSGAMLVAGHWGLGPTTVDGRSTPDLFRVSREEGHPVLESTIARKERMLLCREGEGLVETAVPGWMRQQPCLTRDQLALLGDYGLRLEAHYGRAQDVEWAVDAEERVLILQSRPLRLASRQAQGPGVAALRQGLKPILSEGVIASRGVGAGPVALLASEEELASVPDGAVLVAQAASPLLAEAVHRVAAIVTEAGSAASHLATVAREFRVPAIVGARGAMDHLRPGQVVTVDAEMGNIYEGRQEGLLAAAAAARAEEPADSPLFRRLREVLGHLTPLNLTDPRDRQFKPSGCRTLHDLLRFSHEMAVQEIFLAGSRATANTRGALKLQSPIPLDFYFIDLGGGLEVAEGSRTVAPEQFRCEPLLAVWRGVTEVPWSTGPAVGARAAASTVTSTLASGDLLQRMAEPNFVVVSRSYLNLCFRLGFHFSRVDASLSDDDASNYAAFLFHGGAADAAGKTRRVAFMAKVLEQVGFSVSAREDALFARLDGPGRSRLESGLALLGRLLVVTRQTDTLMTEEGAVERAARAFLAGDYTLGLRPGTGEGR